MMAEILLSASSVEMNVSVADATGELDGINWEVSLANGGNYLPYNALQRPPVCNEKIVGNCIGEKQPGQRHCNYYDLCKRSISSFV